ncbi:MAG: ATP-binding cassette domain-containing protein [Nostocoides sp.]
MNAAITFEGVTITYADEASPALRSVDLGIEEGELALVVGRTGSGKSTLLGAVNGSVPHFTGGTLAGRVTVCGRDTRTHRPRDLADLVGVVGQDPAAGFVTDTVEEELAYGMEQLALPADVMRKRVEETLDLLGIADLRTRPLAQLSGGQQQRVAIGSVLTTHPRVLVLDEPTSALDPTGAEEVLAAITRLVHDLGVTVVLAEHRIERVIQYADLIVHVDPSGAVTSGSPVVVMATSDVAPPIVELGRYAGWSPLPLSVRDARRVAGPLRSALPPTPTPPTPGALVNVSPTWPEHDPPDRAPALSARDVVVRYGDLIAVAGVSVNLYAGEVAALMGRNGAGKSSLLWALQGTGARTSGTVTVHNSTIGELRTDPAELSPAERRRLVGLVPQPASDLLYLDTVDEECAQADRESRSAPGTCAANLERLAPGIPPARHPRDLSEGQRLALVLAIQLTADPPIVLLDEPTRGLDYSAKSALAVTLTDLAAGGRTILLSTHDVEFVATVADRVVVMAEGDVVADGPTAEVVVASPAFAPQVAKILAPLPYLTVEDVRRTQGREHDS